MTIASASFAPDIDDQVFAFEFQDASFGSIDDVSVYTMEVRDPYVSGSLDYTAKSYYIDNPDTSVGGKVRVTDVNGTPFDYLGASRKVDLFYYDDTDASDGDV